MPSDLIRPLLDTFDFNTMTLAVSLSDLGNEQAGHRTRGGEGSSICYLVGHLLASRGQVLLAMGLADENPWHERFGGQAPARDGHEYPPIGELAAAWSELGERFGTALRGLTEDEILAPSSVRLPVSDPSHRGLLQFFAWHESYHVGQVGLLRTELGLPSVQARVHERMREAS